MDKLIAICGIDCSQCDARIATVNNDDALRQKTARLWAELNHAPITAEQINCTGCRTDGPKTVYCSTMCKIRQCALGKGYETCADCPELDACPVVGALFSYNPQARQNLVKKV